MNIDLSEIESDEEIQSAILNMNKALAKILNYQLEKNSKNLIDVDKLDINDWHIDTINFEMQNKKAKLNIVGITKLSGTNSTEVSINFYNHISTVKYNVELDDKLGSK